MALDYNFQLFQSFLLDLTENNPYKKYLLVLNPDFHI